MISAAELLRLCVDRKRNTVKIVPIPEIDGTKLGQASVDLRLGRWFMAVKETKKTHVRLHNDETVSTRKYFVPFGEEFILHPQRFILAATLEWLDFGSMFGGYVIGKSKLGRRGLIIETAAGIHPGFKGCLTLELTNVGEVPLAIVPGMEICQLFVHDVRGGGELTDTLSSGHRGPVA